MFRWAVEVLQKYIAEPIFQCVGILLALVYGFAVPFFLPLAPFDLIVSLLGLSDYWTALVWILPCFFYLVVFEVLVRMYNQGTELGNEPHAFVTTKNHHSTQVESISTVSTWPSPTPFIPSLNPSACPNDPVTFAVNQC